MPSPYVTENMLRDARVRMRRRRRVTVDGERYGQTISYRGPREFGLLVSEGTEARCPCCDHLLRPEDFDTDTITGRLIEPAKCVRCAA